MRMKAKELLPHILAAYSTSLALIEEAKTVAEVKTAFKSAILMFHPDKIPHLLNQIADTILRPHGILAEKEEVELLNEDEGNMVTQELAKMKSALERARESRLNTLQASRSASSDEEEQKEKKYETSLEIDLGKEFANLESYSDRLDKGFACFDRYYHDYSFNNLDALPSLIRKFTAYLDRISLSNIEAELDSNRVKLTVDKYTKLKSKLVQFQRILDGDISEKINAYLDTAYPVQLNVVAQRSLSTASLDDFLERYNEIKGLHPIIDAPLLGASGLTKQTSKFTSVIASAIETLFARTDKIITSAEVELIRQNLLTKYSALIAEFDSFRRIFETEFDKAQQRAISIKYPTIIWDRRFIVDDRGEMHPSLNSLRDWVFNHIVHRDNQYMLVYLGKDNYALYYHATNGTQLSIYMHYDGATKKISYLDEAPKLGTAYEDFSLSDQIDPLGLVNALRIPAHQYGLSIDPTTMLVVPRDLAAVKSLSSEMVLNKGRVLATSSRSYKGSYKARPSFSLRLLIKRVSSRCITAESSSKMAARSLVAGVQ